MSFHEKAASRRWSGGDGLLMALALACCAYATGVALRYAGQVPLDMYSFRQTQTALTSFWFVRDGLKLAYETPVGGPPWSIPFEFPLYQYIVALVSQGTPLGLNQAGRVVSFAFLALSLWPARAIVRKLQLPENGFYIYVILLLSSPLYLYWSRTFMIETTAVFFTVGAISCFIDILLGKNSRRASVIYLGCMAAAVLQKATTGLPALAILGVIYFFSSLNALRQRGVAPGAGAPGLFILRRSALALLYVGVPLAVGIAWTAWTDQLKAMNPLGAHLTAAALSKWNWGGLEQRFSTALLGEVLWRRMIVQNLGGVLGLAGVLLLALSRPPSRARYVVAGALAMGLAPLFLFTNLHIIHTYYQTANVIFLIFALAVIISYGVGAVRDKKRMALGLTMLIAGSNYYWYGQVYRGATTMVFTRENARELALGDLLKRAVPEDKYLVVYGDDWSSALSYFSERKSFTVPGFMEGYNERSADPANYIAAADLGGVVLCGADPYPTADALLAWAAQANWKFGDVAGCLVALPAAPRVAAAPTTEPVSCEGKLEFVGTVLAPGRATLVVTGWNAVDAKNGQVAERIYVTLRPAGGQAAYFEAVPALRPDVNLAYGRMTLPAPGFSRVISIRGLQGRYSVGVARLRAGQLESCAAQQFITIDATTGQHGERTNLKTR